jgi:hypothetical protein
MSKFSRRNFFKIGAAASAAVALPLRLSNANTKSGEDDSWLTFVNGRIHTMNDRDDIVSSVTMQNGRFVSVGNAANPGGGGKVVPGLIESHTHFVSLANRPGYHVAQWELASSIAEVLDLLAARRKDVPQGQFITAMGAGTPRMFAELRLPTLAEIDSAVPDRPVFLYQGGGGPARTNTLGKQFFETATSPLAGPCVVGADGTIASGNPNMANRALYHLRVRQTFDDKKRSALDAMAYSASVGITTNLDQTLVAKATGTLDLASLDPQPTDALFTLNHFRMYDAWLALHREDKAFVRLQINFLHNQGFIAALGDLAINCRNFAKGSRISFPSSGTICCVPAGSASGRPPSLRLEVPTIQFGMNRSARSPRRGGETRTLSPAHQPARPRSSRSSRPTKRWTLSSASKTCVGACSMQTSRRRISCGD